MEQTEDVTATGDGDGGPPGPASGRLLAYGPAVPSSQTPLGNAGAFASAAWDVSGSPYALPSVQEPLGPHGGPGYGYMEHQHQHPHPHPHPHQHHAFVTPPPRTHLAPAQYGAQFTYDYEPRPLEEFDPHLEHGHGSRPYGATDAVGTFRPGSAFAAPPADYDVPGFANVTPAEATVSPYALLNVSSTAERAEDRNELPDDELPDQGRENETEQESTSPSSELASVAATASLSTSGTANGDSGPPASNAQGGPGAVHTFSWGATRPAQFGQYMIWSFDPKNVNAQIGGPWHSIDDMETAFPQAESKKGRPRQPRATTGRAPARRVRRKLSSGEASEGGQSDSMAESDTNNEGLAEDEVEAVETAPLPPTRPTDPVDAVAYDTIKALWRPLRQPLSKEGIQDGLRMFSDIAGVLKDDWAAIEQDKAATPEARKPRFAQQRKLLESCLVAALKHGHKFIVEKLGEHQLFISYLCKVLRDRIREDDHGSDMITTILEFMCRATLTELLLHRCNFAKIQSRLEKKGTDRVRDLVKLLGESASLATKKEVENASNKEAKQEPAKGPTSEPTPTAPVPPQGRDKAPLGSRSGTKRPPESEIAQARPVKKQAATGAAATGTGAVRRTTTGPGLFGPRPTSSASASQGTAATTAATTNSKSRSGPALTPTPNFFADLKSASKYKSTPAAPPSGPSATKPATPARPVFSIFQTLQELNRVTEQETVAETNKYANETEDERKKRLRKEERRKLRVRFKPDDSLEQIRYFTRPEGEETRRAANLVRDAGDAVQEGRVFKQHRKFDMDEDEDEDETLEQALSRPWQTPSLIDYSVVNDITRSIHFEKLGGILKPHSPEKVQQDEREKNILMTVYTEDDDIPPSPTEPPSLDQSEPSPPGTIGSPPSWVRNREHYLLGRREDATPYDYSWTQHQFLKNSANPPANMPPSPPLPTRPPPLTPRASTPGPPSLFPPPPPAPGTTPIPEWQRALAAFMSPHRPPLSRDVEIAQIETFLAGFAQIRGGASPSQAFGQLHFSPNQGAVPSVVPANQVLLQAAFSGWPGFGQGAVPSYQGFGYGAVPSSQGFGHGAAPSAQGFGGIVPSSQGYGQGFEGTVPVSSPQGFGGTVPSNQGYGYSTREQRDTHYSSRNDNRHERSRGSRSGGDFDGRDYRYGSSGDYGRTREGDSGRGGDYSRNRYGGNNRGGDYNRYRDAGNGRRG